MAFHAGVEPSVVVSENSLAIINFPGKLVSTLDISTVQYSAYSEIMNIEITEISGVSAVIYGLFVCVALVAGYAQVAGVA